jgi:hypothetical protein
MCKDMVEPEQLTWDESADGAFFSCSSSKIPASTCEPQLDRTQDPGADAISLLSLDAQSRFTGPSISEHAPSHLSIAELDLEQIRTREPASDGCRDLRDEYHELLTQRRCSADPDCQRVDPVSVPGEPASCPDPVHQAAARRAGEIAATWSVSCQSIGLFCADRGPPVCRNGMCEWLCDETSHVVPCPDHCDDVQRRVGSIGALCAANLFCLDDAGNTCGCDNEQLVCQTNKCTPRCTEGPAPLTSVMRSLAAGSSGSR